LTSVQRIEVSNDRLGSGDVITAVLQADLDKIRETNETADRKSFDAAVDALLAAKRIYILGVRSSAALAGFLGYYFNFIFDDVRIVTSASAGEMTEQISRIRPEDAAIGISFPRYSSATIEAVRFCREAGAAVIGLTDSCTSPVGANAGIVLTAKSDMVSLVDSLTAPMSLINALIVAVASRREKTVSTTFTELERIWGEYNIYEK
jgi:DNA-binding MurR/RpiR family transcriptional regulator